MHEAVSPRSNAAPESDFEVELGRLKARRNAILSVSANVKDDRSFWPQPIPSLKKTRL